MRRFRIALAFLLVGVVLNVAVAWACTALLDPQFQEHYSAIHPGRSWVVTKGRRPGHTQIISSWTSGWGRTEGRPPAAVERHMPKWAFPIDADPSLDLTVETDRIDDAAGWPYITMAGGAVIRYRGDPPQTVKVQVSGIPIELFSAGDQGRALPLRPIWPGFAMNTLFYTLFSGLLWLCLIQGSHRFQRFLWRKRGLCAKCGYDLRGASGGRGVCPECGAGGDGV